ncbi:MAG: cyclodeaminase/cyclohydrolase family protein [Gammaproteobacteria bacterium]|jgi:formiminotetrahydrofolate cyclodeaminase|nr:cyclodeaminase/cyclohydrolase family protein [Gammaproteobacteria bacterium]MBT4491609.1 cyclodeaminase/cyclohydrolase family protein [Gammaproteobacteria bacterium]MBT7370805.1 cyclodeaminase/cyclohydrolase family protein [Gammaproteobacteria bacterium]
MTEIGRQTITEYLNAVSAKTSTPGGGAVAAVVAGEACALIAMVVNFTRGDDSRLQEILSRVSLSRQRLIELADADSVAFDQVMRAYKGEGDLEPALINAAQVPLEVISICRSHISDIELMMDIGNANLLTDVGIAASLIQSSLQSSQLNVMINANAMTTEKNLLTEPLADLPTALQRLVDVLADMQNRLTCD